MVLGYIGSIIVLSLALFGLCNLLSSLWEWMLEPSNKACPSVSLLVLVKDMEDEIESVMNYLKFIVNNAEQGIDIVVADCGSDDFTADIVERIADNSEDINYVNARLSLRPMADVLPYCRGQVVYIFDAVNRIASIDLLPALKRSLRDNKIC